MTRNRLAVVVLPLAVIVANAVMIAIALPDLPDPVATHFDPSGQPDGFMPPVAVLAFNTGFSLALWGLFAAISGASRKAIGTRFIAGLPLAITVFFAAITVTTLWPQRGVVDATEATLPGWTITVAILAGLFGGLLGAWIAGAGEALPATRDGAPTDAVRADIGEATAVWRGETPTSRVMRWLAAVLLVAGALLWWLLDPGPAILLLAVAGLLLASSRYEIVVGPAGIVVRGMIGWPRTRVPLSTVVAASADKADPYEYGGWGWRVRGDTTAVVTRSGPALKVERTDGSDLMISLDDPTFAAGIVNSLLDQRERTV